MPSNLVSADLGRLVAIIPLGALEGAKSRLGGPLDAEERQALVTELLGRTIGAAAAVGAIDAVLVVSPDAAVLRIAAAAGATAIRQPDVGLNEGLGAAAGRAIADGATALLVLPADLPAISPGSIADVVAAAKEGLDARRPLVGLVTDRQRRGTNALLISPPGAIPFAFGPDSRARHRQAAEAAGAVFLEIDSPLALDLDFPDDLVTAEELGLLDPGRAG